MHLRPDLVWRDGARHVFVGDAKYKNIAREHAPNADLYQLLAYTTALNLPGGLLIYAKGEAETATYQVRNSGKRLEVVALDLSGTLDEILGRVGSLAEMVKAAAMVTGPSDASRQTSQMPRISGSITSGAKRREAINQAAFR